MPKILLAIDGSQHALHTVATLAQLAEGWRQIDLHVLNVQAQPPLYGEVVAYLPPEKTESYARAAGHLALADSLGLLKGTSIPYSSEVRLGDTATTIVASAQSLGCALIVIGSRGTGAIAGMLMGSAVTKVIHLSAVPVLVIPSTTAAMGDQQTRTREGTKILLPVDGSAGALAAVREVIRIASWFKVAPEIHLLAIYDRTPLDVQLAAMVSSDQIHQYQVKQFAAVFKQVRDVLSGVDLKVVEHTAIGQPAEEIRLIAKSYHCGLICMGSRGMGAVRNIVLGSVVNKLLHAADVPVLVVPPIAP